MKSKNLLIVLILTGLLTACASSVSTFYQVFKANGDGLVKTGNSLVFEDENCIVSYNLWSEGGNIGFRFYNKTDQNIFLNLDECFLVFNGNAYNYFKNRTYAFSSGTGVEITSGLGGTTSVVGSNSVTGINYLSFLQTDAVSIGGTQSMYFSGSSNVSMLSHSMKKKLYVFLQKQQRLLMNIQLIKLHTGIVICYVSHLEKKQQKKRLKNKTVPMFSVTG